MNKIKNLLVICITLAALCSCGRANKTHEETTSTNSPEPTASATADTAGNNLSNVAGDTAKGAADVAGDVVQGAANAAGDAANAVKNVGEDVGNAAKNAGNNMRKSMQ